MEDVLSFRKVFITLTLCLFIGIAMMAVLKKKDQISLQQEKPPQMETLAMPKVIFKEPSAEEALHVIQEVKKDRIRNFFSKGFDKLPIVETITYTSRVDWLKGRPAWIADYASHYETSRHFIARSLNGKADYETQKVSPGEKFNVFRMDKNFQFYMLVDLKTCTLDFYYLDLDNDARVFLKRYPVGVGREDPMSPSGSLTPIGKYALGEKVAIYKPGVEHYFQNQKVPMIEVFGTRWLPFAEELENCTDSAKGYGIHGVPCVYDANSESLIEQTEGTGTRNSDGCLRLNRADVEELFAIVITKPTIVEIVKDKTGFVLPMSKELELD